MRHYPRFLKRSLCHEYSQRLAPDEKLFSDFRTALEQGVEHNQAFVQVNYESRFELSSEALVELAKLSEISKTRDVF